MSARADEVVLGVGSADAHDGRNPFSYQERAEMLAALGHPNLRVVPIPDLYDGPRWRALVRERLGPLERFVAANGYVRRLLGETYRLSHPLELIPPSPVSGTRVRAALARGDDWQALVPAPVATLIEARGLDRRLRREFGEALSTQALAADAAATTEEDDHVRVG